MKATAIWDRSNDGWFTRLEWQEEDCEGEMIDCSRDSLPPDIQGLDADSTDEEIMEVINQAITWESQRFDPEEWEKEVDRSDLY